MAQEHPIVAGLRAAAERGQAQALDALRRELALFVNYNLVRGASESQIRAALGRVDWRQFGLDARRGVALAFEAARDKRYVGDLALKLLDDRLASGRYPTVGLAWQSLLEELRGWGLSERELVALRDTIFTYPDQSPSAWQEVYRRGAFMADPNRARVRAALMAAREGLVQHPAEYTAFVEPRARQVGVSRALRELERARNVAATRAEQERLSRAVGDWRRNPLGAVGALWAGGMEGLRRLIAQGLTGVPMEEQPAGGLLDKVAPDLMQGVRETPGVSARVAENLLGLVDPESLALMAGLGSGAAAVGGRLSAGAARALYAGLPFGVALPEAALSVREGDTERALGALATAALFAAPAVAGGVRLPARRAPVAPAAPAGVLPPRRLALPPPESPRASPPPSSPSAGEPPMGGGRGGAVAPESPPPPPPPSPSAGESPAAGGRVRVTVREPEVIEFGGRRFTVVEDSAAGGYRAVLVDEGLATPPRPSAQEAARALELGQLQPAEVVVVPAAAPVPPVSVQASESARDEAAELAGLAERVLAGESSAAQVRGVLEAVERVRRERGDDARLRDLAERLRERLGAGGASLPSLSGVMGQESTVYTARGTPVRVRYAVVELDDLVPSHVPSGGVLVRNERYPQALQPRSREEVAYQQQVQGLTRPPETLGASAETNAGAPIVGRDGVVESGNGRVIALLRSRERGGEAWESYQRWLREAAPSLGIDAGALAGMRAPVLVRVREGVLPEEARAALAAEMGLSSGATYTASDLARLDADRIVRGGLLRYLREGDDLSGAENREFVRGFLAMLPADERAELIAPDGGLSRRGLERLRAALLALAVGDERVLRLALEEVDSEVKAVLDGIAMAAPALAQLERLVDAGEVASVYRLRDALARVVLKLNDLRRQGVSVGEYLQQGNLFGERELGDLEEALLAFMAARRGARPIARALRGYAEEARRLGGRPAGMEELDVEVALPSARAALARAVGEGQGGLFDELGQETVRVSSSAWRRGDAEEESLGEHGSGAGAGEAEVSGALPEDRGGARRVSGRGSAGGLGGSETVVSVPAEQAVAEGDLRGASGGLGGAASRSGDVDGGGRVGERGDRDDGGRVSEPDGARGGVGDVPPAERVDRAPAERVGVVSDDAGGALADAEPPAVESRADYVWTAADREYFSRATEKEKVESSLAAIRLLKQLESEGRAPTAAEQAVLARFAGWGAIWRVLDAERSRGESYLREAHAELQELLTKEEWAAAARAALNAHYTSPEVIERLWAIVRQLGFERGVVLEPAAGVGLMRAFAPAGAREGWVMVEKDVITGKILRLLHPGAQVYVQGFEQTPLAKGSVDLVISNVPFGKFGVVDRGYPAYVTGAIHDYFLVKGLDVLREGGLMVVVTSRYSLDKQREDVRRALLARGARLVAAYRLPREAFAGFAATNVVTDVLVFQKGAPAERAEWLTVEPMQVGGQEVKVNAYYRAHPSHVLGDVTVGRGMYSADEYMVSARDLGVAYARWDQLIAGLPRVYEARGGESSGASVADFYVGADAPYGRAYERAGKIYAKRAVVREDGSVLEEEVELRGDVGQWRAYMRVRDALLEVLALDARGADASEARASLKRAYEAYRRQYGTLNRKKGARRRAWEDDLDAPLVQTLEFFDSETGELKGLNAIFEQPIRRRREVAFQTPEEGLIASLSVFGTIRADWVAERLGMTAAQVLERWQAQGLVVETAEGEWVLMEEFLSGNIGRKLLEYRQLASEDARWQRHVELLERVLPPAVPFEVISLQLGASYVPREVMARYLGEMTGHNLVPKYKAGGVWEVDYASGLGRGALSGEFQLTVREWARVAEYALNGRVDLTVEARSSKPDDVEYAKRMTELMRAAVRRLRDGFRGWVLSNLGTVEKQRIEEQYHLLFGSYRPVDYTELARRLDFTLHGMNPEVQLRLHQKRAILRVLRQRGTLLDHEVGAGKTFELVGAAILAKRMGLVRLPVVVVKKATLLTFAREAQRLFPDARILFATEEDFRGDNRRRFLANALMHEWDLVILTHQQFTEVPISEASARWWLDRWVEEESRQLAEGRSAKEVAKYKEQLEVRLARYLDKLNLRRRFGVDFEQVGFDMVLVDESHSWKGMPFYTQIQDAQYSVSEVGIDGLMKLDLVRARGGKVVFASGTPIINKLSEMYIVGRAVAPEVWESAGIYTFEQWRANFAQVTQSLERRPTGEYKVATRIRRYVNVPELVTMYRTFADVFYVADDPALSELLPKLENESGQVTGKYIAVRVPKNAATDALTAHWRERLREADPRDYAGVLLSIYGQAKAAVIDPRLVKDVPESLARVLAAAGEDPNSKVNVLVRKVYEIWESTRRERRTQLIFSDRGVPGGNDALDIYAEIKAKLVALGVPASEIAFIHDAKTDEARRALFEKVNRGEVRVLIGSTEKMGVGVNVQRRLIASHYLDVPWRPADLEQRDGRIRRQGNEFDRVRIYYYVQEGSPIEETLWQVLTSKATMLRELRRGNATRRTVDEVELELDYTEILAAAAGTPEAKRFAEVLRALELAESRVQVEHAKVSAHRRQVADLARRREALQQVVDGLRVSRGYEDAALRALASALEGVEIPSVRDLESEAAALMRSEYTAFGVNPYNGVVEIGTYRDFSRGVVREVEVGGVVYQVVRVKHIGAQGELGWGVAVVAKGLREGWLSVANAPQWSVRLGAIRRHLENVVEWRRDLREVVRALEALEASPPAIDEQAVAEYERLLAEKAALEAKLQQQVGGGGGDAGFNPSQVG